MTTLAQKKGHQPMRRQMPKRKRVSTTSIIAQHLPNIAVAGVGILAIFVMALMFPGLAPIIVTSSMGGVFLAAGAVELIR